MENTNQKTFFCSDNVPIKQKPQSHKITSSHQGCLQIGADVQNNFISANVTNNLALEEYFKYVHLANNASFRSKQRFWDRLEFLHKCVCEWSRFQSVDVMHQVGRHHPVEITRAPEGDVWVRAPGRQLGEGGIHVVILRGTNTYAHTQGRYARKHMHIRDFF